MTAERFAAQVDDDGSPPAALDLAGQAVRDFNHRSFGSRAAGQPGWEGPPDCYRALGELSYLAGGLPQAFEQIARGPTRTAGRSQVAMEPASGWESNPAGVINEATAALEQAALAAQEMYPGIADAHDVLSRAGTAAGVAGRSG